MRYSVIFYFNPFAKYFFSQIDHRETFFTNEPKHKDGAQFVLNNAKEVGVFRVHVGPVSRIKVTRRGRYSPPLSLLIFTNNSRIWSPLIKIPQVSYTFSSNLGVRMFSRIV
jgi:hypothetical protein